MRGYRLLTDIRLWLSGISRKEMSLRCCFEDRVRVLWWVSITYPGISLNVAQFLSLSNTFFRMAEYFTSLGKEEKISPLGRGW